MRRAAHGRSSILRTSRSRSPGVGTTYFRKRTNEVRTRSYRRSDTNDPSPITLGESNDAEPKRKKRGGRPLLSREHAMRAPGIVAAGGGRNLPRPLLPQAARRDRGAGPSEARWGRGGPV